MLHQRNMRALVEKEQAFGEQCEKLRPAFATDIRDNDSLVCRMIMTDLEYLLFSGQVYARPVEQE